MAKSRKGYFVYKYVVSGEIIYIGIAKDIVRRIREHTRCQGLDSKFEPYINKAKIYVHKCSTYSEMRALETILIDLHKPVLNELGKTDIPSSLSQASDYGPWTLYNEDDYIERKMMPAQNKSGRTKATISLKKYLSDGGKIYCSVCGKDLSKEPGRANVNIHTRSNVNSGKQVLLYIHTACKGKCTQIDDADAEKMGSDTLHLWFSLSDFFNPVLYLKKMFFFMERLNDGMVFEDTNELKNLKRLFVQTAPYVMRDVDEEDKKGWIMDNIITDALSGE